MVPRAAGSRKRMPVQRDFESANACEVSKGMERTADRELRISVRPDPDILDEFISFGRGNLAVEESQAAVFSISASVLDSTHNGRHFSRYCVSLGNVR